jgi:hypothetical protein
VRIVDFLRHVGAAEGERLATRSYSARTVFGFRKEGPP